MENYEMKPILEKNAEQLGLEGSSANVQPVVDSTDGKVDIKDIVDGLVAVSEAIPAIQDVAEKVENGEHLWDALFNTESVTELGTAWLNVFGYSPTSEDLNFAHSVGNIIAAVNPIQLAKDLSATVIKAAQSQDITDDVAGSLITAVGDALRRGTIPRDDWDVVTKQLLGYALPYAKENADDWIRAIFDQFANWFVEGAERGISMPISLLLSGLYRVLPEAGKTGLLAGLAALIDAKAMVNPITTATDLTTTLINQIARLAGVETQILPIQAATNVIINGVEWSLFPFGSCYILIASENVSGPDVIFYKAGVGKGPRDAISKVVKVTSGLLGKVPMGDLVNAIVRGTAHNDMLDALLEASNYDDTIRGVTQRILQELVSYATGKLVGPLLANFNELHDAATSKAQSAIKSAASTLIKKARKIFSMKAPSTSPEVDVRSVEELDSLMPPTLSDGIRDSSLDDQFAGDVVTQLRKGRQYQEGASVDDLRVEQWYKGRSPYDPGTRF